MNRQTEIGYQISETNYFFAKYDIRYIKIIVFSNVVFLQYQQKVVKNVISNTVRFVYILKRFIW